MPVNAFTATAASMLKNGDSPEQVRETLGLSETELAEALRHTELLAPAAADTEDSTSTPEAAAPVPARTTDADKTEALLGSVRENGVWLSFCDAATLSDIRAASSRA
ncbi:hypothetical protein ACWFR5_25990 [Streptomyces sp. NPDC055092]